MSGYLADAWHRSQSVSVSTRLAHKSLAFSRDGIGTTARQLAKPRPLMSPERRGMTSSLQFYGQVNAVPSPCLTNLRRAGHYADPGARPAQML